jgi:hypothetical protein
MHPHKLDKQGSVLVVVDMQDKLLHATQMRVYQRSGHCV